MLGFMLANLVSKTICCMFKFDRLSFVLRIEIRNLKLRSHKIARVDGLVGGHPNESFYKSSSIACQGTRLERLFAVGPDEIFKDYSKLVWKDYSKLD